MFANQVRLCFFSLFWSEEALPNCEERTAFLPHGYFLKVPVWEKLLGGRAVLISRCSDLSQGIDSGGLWVWGGTCLPVKLRAYLLPYLLVCVCVCVTIHLHHGTHVEVIPGISSSFLPCGSWALNAGYQVSSLAASIFTHWAISLLLSCKPLAVTQQVGIAGTYGVICVGVLINYALKLPPGDVVSYEGTLYPIPTLGTDRRNICAHVDLYPHFLNFEPFEHINYSEYN